MYYCQKQKNSKEGFCFLILPKNGMSELLDFAIYPLGGSHIRRLLTVSIIRKSATSPAEENVTEIKINNFFYLLSRSKFGAN